MKQHKYRLILLVFLITCTSYSADTLSAEDYKVYSAVLEQIILSMSDSLEDTNKQFFINVNSKISSYKGGINLVTTINKRDVSMINKGAFNNFKSKKKSFKFDITYFNKSINNFSIYDFDKLFDSIHNVNEQKYVEKFWEAIPIIFPGYNGYYSLSQIGYNKKRNKAIVSYSYKCGGLCGVFFLVQLKKVKEVWEIEWRTLIGMS